MCSSLGRHRFLGESSLSGRSGPWCCGMAVRWGYQICQATSLSLRYVGTYSHVRVCRQARAKICRLRGSDARRRKAGRCNLRCWQELQRSYSNNNNDKNERGGRAGEIIAWETGVGDIYCRRINYTLELGSGNNYRGVDGVAKGPNSLPRG